jgi:hypothetical protein
MAITMYNGLIRVSSPGFSGVGVGVAVGGGAFFAASEFLSWIGQRGMSIGHRSAMAGTL